MTLEFLLHTNFYPLSAFHAAVRDRPETAQAVPHKLKARTIDERGWIVSSHHKRWTALHNTSIE